MTETKFQPGTLVRDNRGKVGKVAGSPGSVTVDGVDEQQFTVDFWGEKERRLERWLTPLDDDCPEALLLNRPADLTTWADEAPLKLVALALAVDGGSGKMADIRAKLEGRVIEDSKWKNWWSKRSKALASLPKHFNSVKAPKGNEYTLLSRWGDVPADWKPPVKHKSATAADWREWLQSGAPAPSPGRFPAKQVANSYANWSSKWTGKTINDALFGLIARSEETLVDGGMNPQAAEGWLSTIAQAAIRWRESGQGDTAGYAAARVGGVMAQLARIAGERTPQELLLQAAALDGKVDAWRRGFLAGMWEIFYDEDARDLYLRSHGVLGRQAREDMARAVFLAAFGPNFSERQHAELDRLLDALPGEQRLQLLREVIPSATPAQRPGVANYIASSRHAAGPENLELRMMASLTLAGEQDDLAKRTSREVADLVADLIEQLPRIVVSKEQAIFPRMPAPVYVPKRPSAVVLEDAAREMREEIAEKDREIEDLKENHEAKLESEGQEQERLRKQVRERNAELSANRRESRLEVMQDTLLLAGEVLQCVHRWASLEEAVRDSEAGLSRALRAGGAELFESAATMVKYDPLKHSAEVGLSEGCLVKVVAPGVIYRGGIHGDRVLLKAQVELEAG